MVNCNHCGREIPAESHFCPYCGTATGAEDQPSLPLEALEAAAQETLVGTTIEEGMRGIQETVSAIAADLSRQSNRLGRLEQAIFGVSSEPSSQPPTTTSPSAPQSAGPRPAPGHTAASAATPAATVPLRSPVLSARPPSGGILAGLSNWNWEWLFGGNWLARIGIVAVIMGIVFFLKLAIDNSWIGETGRVVLGIVVGLALLGGGEFWRGKYPIWAQPLTGGGIAVLYVSIFASFSLYGLISALTALGFFFLLTVTAAALSLRYEAMAIAILGIIGGFATPLLLSEQLLDQRALLAYVLVLDIGVLSLATFRNWRWFTLLGWLGSLILFAFWNIELEPSLFLSQVGITLIFLIFVGATTLFHVIWRRVPGPADLALMLLNAASYFGISYGQLFSDFRPWMGGFTLLLAVFYGLLGYSVLLRSKEQVYLTFFTLGIAVVFLTIAVPVQLGGPWISVAWAVEGAVLIWLSFALRMPHIRLFGLGVFIAFAVWLLFIDTPDAFATKSQPFLNTYALAYVVGIGITFLVAYLLRRERESLLPWEEYLFPAFLVAGNVLVTVAIPTQASGTWIAVAWAAEAVILMGLSFILNLYQVRLFSLGVFAIVALRLVGFDTFNVDSRTFKPIMNLRFLAFGVGIASMYLAALILWMQREKYFFDQEKLLIPVFLVAANVLTLWLLSAEVIASVDSEFFGVPQRLASDVTSLSLSILWATYAGIVLVVGVTQSLRWIRLGGLGLLAIPVIKLFVYDVFSLEQEYRVVAFLGLGGILVAGGFLYQRYGRVIRGFLLE